MKRYCKTRQTYLNLAVLAVLLLPASAGATTIFSNLSALNVVNGGFAVNATTFAANSFMTGGSSANLSDVILALEAVPSASGTLTVSLYSSASGSPATDLASLGTIADNSNALSTSLFTSYTLDVSGVTLAADTQYFIVLSGSTSGTLDGRWETANSGSGTDVSGQVHGEYTMGAWGVQSNSSDSAPFVMQVDTSAGASTPEPGTLLGALGGFGVFLFMRLRRRA